MEVTVTLNEQEISNAIREYIIKQYTFKNALINEVDLYESEGVIEVKVKLVMD